MKDRQLFGKDSPRDWSLGLFFLMAVEPGAVLLCFPALSQKWELQK